MRHVFLPNIAAALVADIAASNRAAVDVARRPVSAEFRIDTFDREPFPKGPVPKINQEKPYGKNARRRARGGCHD